MFCRNPSKKSRYLPATKEKMDGTLKAAVLCSYDAEDVDKIVGGVSRAGNIGANPRLLARNWCGNSIRLRIKGLADNS